MKHQFTKEQIQAAIDAACLKTNDERKPSGEALALNNTRLAIAWNNETPARLHLAEKLLELLPETSPAETPWTEWHGGSCPLKDAEVEEWEIEFRDGGIDTSPSRPQNTRWHYHGTDGDIIAYRVTKWKEGFGPVGESKSPKPHPISTLTQDQVDATPAMQAAVDAVLNEVIHEGGEVFEKVEPVDPYAELKAAHAEGKDLEFRDEGTDWNWKPCKSPGWFTKSEYRIKPIHETFTVHGKEWTRHVPGDPMPFKLEEANQVEGIDSLNCTWTGDALLAVEHWENKDYRNPFIGWRYAYKAPEAIHDGGEVFQVTPAQWTPKVGDVVKLKSGGLKMTILELLELKGCPAAGCEWFNPAGEYDSGTFKLTSITKADS